MGSYANVDGTWRKTKDNYIKVDDTWRRIPQLYVNDDNVWKLVYSDCGSRTINWSNCSGTASSTQQDKTTTVSNTATGYSGSATFTCDKDLFSLNSGSTCDYINNNCGSQTLYWSNCWGTASETTHGSNRTVSNSGSGYSGSATYYCNNGSYVYQSGSCNVVYNSCPTQTVYWSNCWGSATSISHGGTRSVSNSGSGYSGSATYYCNNGSWQYQSGSCTQNVVQCPNTFVTWGPWTGPGRCCGYTGNTNSGNSVYVSHLQSACFRSPNTAGNYSYWYCNNGSWSILGSAGSLRQCLPY